MGRAAIVRVAAPLDVAAFLKFVDVDDDAAGQNTQLCAEGLLAAAWPGGDGAQNSCMRGGQINGGHLFGEQRRGMVTELSQQKGHAVGTVARG